MAHVNIQNKSRSLFSLFNVFFALALLMIATIANAKDVLVEGQWLANNLNQSNLVVIDLRGADAYEQGHIPGSVNAPYGQFKWRETIGGIVGQLPVLKNINQRIGSLGVTPNSRVIVVPSSKNSSSIGSGIRVVWTFQVLGHDNVALLNGGFKSWTGKLEKGAFTPITNAKPYPGRLQQQLIISAEEIKGATPSELVVVDARPDNQYNGSAKHPKSKVAGTIPDAKRLPQHLLFDTETLRFKSASEIREVASSYGFDLNGLRNKTVASFCNTGHWASSTWFALQHVAKVGNVKLYDGSMVEFTNKYPELVANKKSKLGMFWNNLKQTIKL